MMITIEVEVEHVSGKFAGKDAVFEALAELLDTGEVEVDEATYEVVSVNMAAEPKGGNGMQVELSDREVATVLAALRNWQMDAINEDLAEAFAGHFEDHEPLSDD